MKEVWKKEKLSKVCEKITDGTHQTPKYFDNGFLFLSSRNVTSGMIDWENVKYIDAKQHEEMQRRVSPRRNDILLAKNGTTGVAAIVDKDVPFDIYVSLALLRPLEPILPKFLLYFINSPIAKKQFNKRLKGIGVPNLHLEEIREVELSYPESKAEQQRIVGILDEAFDGIATAKANAERNLQNSRALFESHLQSVFTQRGKGWAETTLGAEIDLLTGFPFKSSLYTRSDKDIRLLRGDNIIQGSLRWEDVVKWPASDIAEYTRYRLCGGDVVLAMDRPWIKAGLKHAIISEDDLPCLLVQRTARLRGGSTLKNRFLMYLIGSSAFTRHILGVQTGIGVPHISGQQIKDFSFLRPPVEDQDRIADTLDGLKSKTQRLESIYQQKLAALDELKKSLLHQAFTGQL